MYFFGAFLTIFGTLYGTIEVAPAIARELLTAMNGGKEAWPTKQTRAISVTWAGVGGMLVLLFWIGWWLRHPETNPPGLIAILTPANLFTGVLACGLVCLTAIWADAKYMPRALRTPLWLSFMAMFAGGLFCALGLKAYWDDGHWGSFGILASTLLTGLLAGPWICKWLGKGKLDGGT